MQRTVLSLFLVVGLLIPASTHPLKAQVAEGLAPEDAGAAPGKPSAPYARRAEKEGITLDVRIDPVDPHREAGELLEGDPVRVRLAVRDGRGNPIPRLYPGGWLDRLPETPEPQPSSCREKVQTFIGGSLLAAPEVDLNTYYVLTLNNDASISVVDPLFGFGGTKLLAMVLLESPGEDWVLSRDEEHLFVSMPRSHQVAVVGVESFKVERNLDVGQLPTRLALQPDGRYLWVAYEGSSEGGLSGVSVIDVETLREVARIATGRGRHDLAFSDDDRFVFVTNEDDDNVSVVGVRELRKLRDVATDAGPVGVSYSTVGGAAYVSHRRAGTVVALDGETHRVVARMQAEPGLGAVRFAPGGRWGFVVNPLHNAVHILDAAGQRIIQTGDTEPGPDQVIFSDEMAYLRHRGSETVLMVPLAGIGREGAPVPVIDFPGGTSPPGATDMPSRADGIVQAPGAPAVLVANPGDKAIYYYKEGMAAPMGHFINYDREPRAVMVVDRSLEEVEPGVYQTTVRLGRAGNYEIALFVDSPRMVECFPLEVAVNPALGRDEDPRRVDVLLEASAEKLEVGKPVTVKVTVLDPDDASPEEGLRDIRVLTFLAPGVWQQRYLAEPRGEGVYEISFTPPQAGIYYVFVEIASRGIRFNASPSLLLEAKPAEPAG